MNEYERAELAALQDINQAFDRVFDCGPLGIALVRRDFRFTRVNQRLCDMLGYSEDELLALTFPQITHPDDIGKNVDLTEKAFNNEIPHYEMEKRYIKKSGEPVWVKLTATYVRDDDGEPVCGLAMVEDISERKATEERVQTLNTELEARIEELLRANQQLEKANKELEAFSATVSHDLKGPLVTVGQFSHILLGRETGPLTDRQADIVGRIRTAGLQAKHIIDDLRDLADVTRRQIFAEEIDLSGMAEKVVEDLRTVVPDRDVTFEVRPDLRVYGDPALIRLLLANLLQNAWKYTGPREQALISMGMEEGPIRKVFFVRDNGIGFDNVHCERIFEAFERLHTEAEFGGTGLGLATARRIVNRHGGEIWAEGTPGEGATFWFAI